MVPEAGAEFADDAGGVFYQEANVEPGDDFGGGDDVESVSVRSA